MVTRQLLQRALAKLRAPLAVSVPAPQPTPPDTPGPWQPLPGNVIELGATGFQIQLDVSARMPLYVLRATEGFVCGGGGDLAGLKQLGERFARERGEFVCKPMEMKW